MEYVGILLEYTQSHVLATNYMRVTGKCTAMKNTSPCKTGCLKTWELLVGRHLPEVGLGFAAASAHAHVPEVALNKEGASGTRPIDPNTLCPSTWRVRET